MPIFSPVSAARRATGALSDNAAALAIVAGVGFLVIGGALAGAPSYLLVGIAALPLLLGVGRNLAFALVVGLVLVRTLTDNSGVSLVSITVAMAITALALLVMTGSHGVAVPFAAALVFFFVSAAAGASAHGSSITFGEAFRLTSVVAVAVVAAHAPGRLTVGRLTRVVQLIAVVPALFAVYQLTTGTGSDIAGSIRSNGTLAHPNSAAMLFALANLASFARVLQRKSGKWRDLAFLALFVVAQASTGSVGGVAAMIAMILAFLFARPVRRADRIALTTAGLGIGALLVLTSSIGASRISEFENPQPGKDNSFQWRLSAWSDVLGAWRQHVLFGNGLGSTLAKTIVPGNIPHNEYVRLLAEIGLVGFGMTIAIGIGLAMSLARHGRMSTTPEAASLALAALAGTAVNALAANTLLYSASTYVTMLIVGGCWRILRDSGSPPSGPDAARRMNPGRHSPTRLLPARHGTRVSAARRSH